MLSLLLAVALAAAPAAKADCVLPRPVKVFKGNFTCAPGLTKIQCGKDIRCVTSKQAQECKTPVAPAKVVVPVVVPVAPVTPPVVVPPVVKPVPVVVPVVKPAVKAVVVSAPVASPWRVLGFVEGGPTFCGPKWRGMGGVRLTYEPLRLGIELDTMIKRGSGARLLVYPIVSEHFRWQLNAGIHGQGTMRPNLTDLPLGNNWAAGTGIEVPVFKHFGLMADYRYFHPTSTPAGFSSEKITENSFKESMVFGGVFAQF